MAEINENLWAPWRMPYIHSLHDARTGVGEGCFLCRYVAAPDQDAAHHVLWRRNRTLTVFNAFPYSAGHLLVAPQQHLADLEDLDPAIMAEMMLQARDAKRLLAKLLSAQGFNIGLNLGRCAGAGLPGHLHLHVVPRWEGDSNFMSVLSDVRVISQSLESLYEHMRQATAALGLPPIGESSTDRP